MTSSGREPGSRVDYERSAEAYRRARTLPPAVLAAWQAAVAPWVRGDERRLLDLGAGPGQFLDPLTAWFDCAVVAVEPSEAMRHQAIEQGLADRFAYVAAVAERLPFAADTFDGAWLSTVIHQFDDRVAAVADLRRVVRTAGRVFVRGFFADQPVTGLLAHFPGIDRVAATFPSTDAIVDELTAAGFGGPAVVDVSEPWTFEREAWIERARSIRHTDSAFRPLTDEEFEAGIDAVATAYADHTGPIAADATLRLLVLDH